MRVALDTNILAYAEGVNEDRGKLAAIEVLNAYEAHDVLVPAQVLAELFSVLLRKLRLHPEEAGCCGPPWC